MAFITTESQILDITSGSQSLLLLVGTATSTAGDVGGTIIPSIPTSGSAATNANGTTSASLRKVLATFYSSSSAGPSEVQAITTYSAANDRDHVIIATAANQAVTYFILGFNAGA